MTLSKIKGETKLEFPNFTSGNSLTLTDAKQIYCFFSTEEKKNCIPLGSPPKSKRSLYEELSHRGDLRPSLAPVARSCNPRNLGG
jgi:hypothetical protein